MFIFAQCQVGAKLERWRLEADRNATVDSVRKLIVAKYNESLMEGAAKVPVSAGRLLFKGKQLENGMTIFDYDVKPNETIQLFIRAVSESKVVVEKVVVEENPPIHSTTTTTTTRSQLMSGEPPSIPLQSIQVGMRLECFDPNDTNSWYEAVVERVQLEPEFSCSILYEGHPDDDEERATVTDPARIKPLSDDKLEVLSVDGVAPGQTVLVNYNYHEPEELGHWYEGVVEALLEDQQSLRVRLCHRPPYMRGKGGRTVTVKLGQEKCFRFPRFQRMLGSESASGDGGVYEKEPEGVVKLTPVAIAAPTELNPEVIPESKEPAANNEWDCDLCLLNPNREKCEECGCAVCQKRDDTEPNVLCDECIRWFHLACIGLTEMPKDEDWFCKDCVHENNIIRPGEKVKSSKKLKMPSAQTTKKHWGKGMACVGMTKQCTFVDKDHIGPVPGVLVGTCWGYRIQAAEAGIHRAPVSGICGSAKKGAVSICMSKGYEEDEDNGEEFFYTGSGGRDLSGNKRNNVQTFDQQLTASNLALAVTCDAKVNDKEGATAKDWRKSRPIRVLRTYQMRKRGAEHGKYAPELGCRYDGCYKMVRYWPEKSKISGFVVWRFQFRRDDEAPAPWTDAWKEWAAEQPGLDRVILPEGTLLEELRQKQLGEKPKNTSGGKGAKRNGASADSKEPATKRAKKEVAEEDQENTTPPSTNGIPPFRLPTTTTALIRADKANAPVWDSLLEFIAHQNELAANPSLLDSKPLRGAPLITQADFMDRISEHFACAICQSVAGSSGDVPITLSCGGGHTFCMQCLLDMSSGMTSDTRFAALLRARKKTTGMRDPDDILENEEGEEEEEECDDFLGPAPASDGGKKETDLAVCCPMCRKECPELCKLQASMVASSSRARKLNREKWLAQVERDAVLPRNEPFCAVLCHLGLRRDA